MSDIGDALSAMSVLGIFLFAAGMVAIPRKKDDETMRTVRRIARHTVTATLLCAIAMGVLALAVVK